MAWLFAGRRQWVARPYPSEWRRGRLSRCLLRLDALEACSAFAQMQHHLLKQGNIRVNAHAKGAFKSGTSALRCRSCTELDSRAQRSSRDRKLCRRSRSIATNVPACSRPTGYASAEVGGVSRALASGAATGFLQRGCSSSGCSPAHALCRSSRSNSLWTSSAPCYCRKGAGPTFRARTTESRALLRWIRPKRQGP